LVDTHGLEVEGKCPWSDTDSDTPREPSVEPRDLFGEQGHGPERKEDGTCSRPSARHRRELESGHLERIRKVPGKSTVMFGGHDAIETGLDAERSLLAELINNGGYWEFIVWVEAK
jgi:hypothetical protein